MSFKWFADESSWDNERLLMREYMDFCNFSRGRKDAGEFVGPDGPMDGSDIRRYFHNRDGGGLYDKPIMSVAGWD